ncbi:sugar phosphate isomerase/epimerase [Parapedobacter sp. ISTM3]|uniref:Sugar phosphate isomerase/epimerase n=1 Tax=Parapedobacter luteus TaxID=623280 RepID=A0A1T5AG26_9SPHI|nr:MULTISPECIES: sugar phosphate isomerase/epimerase family protein [Parapedobacter]MBK1441850.1 sugar phosphate isomerase/epimerase [Parapedobacter sp. ISTM3]SKB33860.1 Sugar phosphate isomerase/epimerase [Parapedobacter luteus]
METRKTFIQKGLLGVSAAMMGFSEAWARPGNSLDSMRGDDRFALGIAGYSFVHFGLDESLAMMKRMDVRYLCIKDFHLPLTSTDAEIKAFHEKLAASGVTGYAVGPIYMTKSKTEIDNAFEYAKRVGVKLIVGIPNKEDLAYIADKAKAYDIRYAIHNHGPEDKLYPNATSIFDLVKNLDERMGLCFDMGHNMRDGQDPIGDLKRYHRRIFDIHLKNVTAATKDGKTCELGRGVINIPEFVKMLRKVGYDGKCSLEFEKDMKDPLAGLAESAGYFRGVLDASA